MKCRKYFFSIFISRTEQNENNLIDVMSFSCAVSPNHALEAVQKKRQNENWIVRSKERWVVCVHNLQFS